MSDAAEELIRVLLVEDDAESGTAVQAMLQRRDVAVTIVTAADEAMRELAASEFDVVVADIRLEGMSGVDLLRDIRQERPDFPVILITGFDSLESAIQAVRLGAQDYILKPVDTVEDLLLPIHKAVRSYRVILRSRALEQELRTSEARFRAVLENSRDIAFRFDLKRRAFDYVSPSCESILGYTAQFLESLSISAYAELLHPDDAEAARRFFDATPAGASRDHTLLPLEWRVKTESGQFRWLSVTHAVQLDDEQEPIALVGTVRDVTERKRMEDSERELREKLARSERMESLGLLAGGVAHDLNNILTGIVGLPDLMLLKLKQGQGALDIDKMREYLRTVRQSGRQASAVVQDLLTLARRGAAQAEALILNGVIEEYLRSPGFRDRADASPDVVFKTDLADDVLPILGSPPHLSQVIMNLIINAFDAMPDGGHLTVTTSNHYLDKPRRL